MTSATSHRFPGLVVGGGLTVVAFATLAILDARNETLREGFVDQTIALTLLAFVGFGVAAWSNERRPFSWRWIWIIAVVLRLLMLTTTPTLSDDVYRYLWEGHLISEGVSPYEAPIGDPALDDYAIPARSLANTPTFASPYLPSAHVVFAASAVVLPSEPLSMQLVMVSFELAAAGGLVILLRVVRASRERILLWLWNPLVILEVAHGAHLDAIMVALSVWALVATFDERVRTRTRHSLLAPILLALASLTRPVPLLLMPVLVRRWTWLQRLGFALTLVVVLAPFAAWSGLGLSGERPVGLFGSARIYGESFRFNTAIYQSLESWIGGRGLDDRGWNEPILLTRLAIGMVFGLILLWTWRRSRQVTDPLAIIRLAIIPVAAYVLLAPVMHPWYLMLLGALVVFVPPIGEEPRRRWLYAAPWAWVLATIPLSYLTYQDPNRFAELAWVRRVTWWPALVMLVGVGAMTLQEQRSAPRSVAPSQSQEDRR